MLLGLLVKKLSWFFWFHATRRFRFYRNVTCFVQHLGLISGVLAHELEGTSVEIWSGNGRKKCRKIRVHVIQFPLPSQI